MKKMQRDSLESIFRRGLNAVDPENAVLKYVRRDKHILYVDEKHYDLKRFKRVSLIGAGKGTAPMAKAIEDILGDYLAEGLIVVKYGYGMPLSKTTIIEAGHPIPDKSGLKATQKIIKKIEDLTEDDLIICALSGGGSALLPAPSNTINLDQKQETTRLLLECGATINEINAVRKHLSFSKGGGLAKAAYPATLVTLILSDVVGDRLDIIASGPTVADENTFSDCIDIIDRYDLREKLPGIIVEHFEQGAKGDIPETPKPGNQIFSKTQNVIVGNNRAALRAAKEEATSRGYNTMIVSSQIEGEAKDAGKFLAAIGKEISKANQPISPPACILAGGETTVTIKGNGRGGRNQELALSFAIAINGWEKISFISAGTDGTDGPTDAAGAIVDGTTYRKALNANLNPYKSLENNDSHTFFKSLDNLLITGPTRTNVMDVMCIIIDM